MPDQVAEQWAAPQQGSKSDVLQLQASQNGRVGNGQKCGAIL